MRTTLDLPDSLFKEVKNRAVQQGVTLKALLTSFIKAGLRLPQTSVTDSSTRSNLCLLPVAIARIPGTPLHPALTNAELEVILEGEELKEHQRVKAQIKSSSPFLKFASLLNPLI